MANRQNWAEVTQWIRKENHLKVTDVLRTCRKENSVFANYFSAVTNGALSTVSPSKMLALPVWKVSHSHRKIQKLKSDGQQLTESQNKRKSRISKVAHSSGHWTKFGVGILDSLHSEVFCSAESSWWQIVIVSLFTGVSIYIKLKFRHLWHYLHLKEYMPSCEKQAWCTENCKRPLMLCYLQLKKYTLTYRQ